jgi:hypothetical protein
MSILRFEIPFFQALLILWADMLMGIAAHGLEHGVLSTVIEFSMNRLRSGCGEIFSPFGNLLRSLREG